MTKRRPRTPTAITMAAWALARPEPRPRPLRPPCCPRCSRAFCVIRARPSRLALPVRAAFRSSREDRRRRAACSGGRRHRDRRQLRDRGVRSRATRTAPPRSLRNSPTWSCARRRRCPTWIADLLPADHDEVNSTLVGWMRAHAADLELAGRDTGRGADLRDPRHDRRRDDRAARRARAAAPIQGRSARALARAPQPVERVPPRRVRAGAHLAHQHRLHRRSISS